MVSENAPWRTEQGTHRFTVEALFKGKNVLRCERRLCLIIWYQNKPMPSTTCWGKDDR